MRKVLLVILALVVLAPLGFLVARSTTPVVDVSSPISTIGQATPVTVHVRDPRGVRKLEAFVEQNGARYFIRRGGHNYGYPGCDDLIDHHAESCTGLNVEAGQRTIE